MEELVPICVRRVSVKTPLGDIVRDNIKYFNVVVKNCPPYVPNPEVKDGYIRAALISRIKGYKQNLNLNTLDAGPGTGKLEWPDHPKDTFGDHIGAIVILKSLDNKILILRNEHLWGLPKGVRNYTEFHKIKTQFTEIFNETGNCPTFTEPLLFENVESGAENICRETMEETGIELNPDNLVLWAGPEDQSAYTKFFYPVNFHAAEYAEILLKNGTDHENDEIKWIDYSELQQMLQQHRSSRQTKVFNHVTYTYLSQWARVEV
jgi:8-oxo-dGTP pyrophosphatase MutT (NUDIX family)